MPNLLNPTALPSLKIPSKRRRNPSPRCLLPLTPPSPGRLPPFFQSPILSDALATFDSLSAATAEAGASLNLATLLRSFCDAGISPADALTLFNHISSPDAASTALPSTLSASSPVLRSFH